MAQVVMEEVAGCPAGGEGHCTSKAGVSGLHACG